MSENSKGLDVSHWVSPKWFHWLEEGYIFAYLKLTEGTTWTDNRWLEHYGDSEGYYRGPYHYFRVQNNGKLQAEHFWNEAKKQTWDMRPVIDVEKYNNTAGPRGSGNRLVSQAVFAARLRNCLIETEKLFGIRPMIYTSQSMWHFLVGSTSWASAYDLWVAHYTTYPIPLIPNDWKGRGYRMWQFTSSPIDQNRFDGGLSKFLEWMGKSEPPTGEISDVKVSYNPKEVKVVLVET